jgi:hypothetical protein
MRSDVASPAASPPHDIDALPDLAHRQVGLGLREIIPGRQLGDALTGDAEESSDFCGADEVMHKKDHRQDATRHLTRGQGRGHTSHMTRTQDMTTATGLNDYLQTLPSQNLREIAARPVFNAESAAMSLTAAAVLALRGE